MPALRLIAMHIWAGCLACLIGTAAMAQDTAPIDGSAAPAVDRPAAGQGIPALVVPSDGTGQQLPIMTIDQDRLFTGSAWGRRVQNDLVTTGRDLADENERLLQQFSREEEELTRLRDTLSAEDFRARADEFDRRVVEVRRERDSAKQRLEQLAQEERDAFYNAVMPILAQMMQERHAVVVLDQRMVLVRAQAIDVTDDLIKRLDSEAGEGPATRDPSPPASGQPDKTPASDAQPEAGSAGQ